MKKLILVFAFASFAVYSTDKVLPNEVQKDVPNNVSTVKPEDTYKYYPKETVVHQGGRSPVIVINYKRP